MKSHGRRESTPTSGSRRPSRGLARAPVYAPIHEIVQRVQGQGPPTSTGRTSTERSPLSVAAAGVRGGGAPLPFLERIQSSFGKHDLSGVRAFRGSDATRASRSLGAEAYTVGTKVAFGKTPSLHTAAHEAAHVIQQRAGVSLKGELGEAGDSYEEHADRVADRVVEGRSAEALLSRPPRGSSTRSRGAAAPLIQRKMGMEFQTVSSGGPKVVGIQDSSGMWHKPEKGHGTLISMQNGWKLEKDELDLEYITDAIDERTAGVDALSDIIVDMYATTRGWLANNTVPVDSLLAQTLGLLGSDFKAFVKINRRTSGLDLSLDETEGVPSYLLGFPDGADVYGSPQVTMGVRLTHLSKFFERMVPDKVVPSKDVEVEDVPELGGGFGVKPSDRRTKQLQKMQKVVSLVRKGLSEYDSESDPPLTDKVRGVLTFAMANLASALGHKGGKLFKDTAAFMHRTSFSGMYKTFKEPEKESYKYFLTNEESPIVKAFTGMYHKGLAMKINRTHFGGMTIGKFLTHLSKGKDPWVVKEPTTKQIAGLHSVSELDRKKYGITRETDIGHDSETQRRKLIKRSGAILEIRSLPRTTLTQLPALAKSLQAFLKELHADE